MSPSDYSAARDAWRTKYLYKENSLQASWELAGIEEQWGDSLFFGDETGGATHYRAAQQALFPTGMMFTSREEHDRRMEAHNRIVNKLYAVGPDGKPRPAHDGQPHPHFHPRAKDPVPESPEPPEKSKAERREAVLHAQQARSMEQTELGQLHRKGDHWRDHHLGELWLAAAKALAIENPAGAGRACKWSLHYFERYNEAWTQNLPASRWDSDGGAEMTEALDLEKSLIDLGAEPALPGWASLLLDGDWPGALESLGDGAPAPELKALVVILADACQSGGREDAARRLLEWSN